MLNLTGPITVALLLSQAAPGQERPQFEVASLKPNTGCENTPRRAGNLSPSPGRLDMPCVTLENLIQTAFGTFGDGVRINSQPLHMEGGPSWTHSEHYTLSAKADGPTRTEMLAGPMLQSLLEERFLLKIHREMREIPVYVITVGSGGLKIKQLAEGACMPLDLTHPPDPPKLGDPRPNLCGIMMMGYTEKGDLTIDVRGSTMTQFAQRLSGRVDRTVIDKTGVPGMFNFHLEFAPDSSLSGQRIPVARRGEVGDAGNSGNVPLSPEPGLSIFMALQEQIGVKLSSGKGPVSFLIIDRAEKPTPN